MSYLEQYAVAVVLQITLALAVASLATRVLQGSPAATHFIGMSAVALALTSPVLVLLAPQTGLSWLTTGAQQQEELRPIQRSAPAAPAGVLTDDVPMASQGQAEPATANVGSFATTAPPAPRASERSTSGMRQVLLPGVLAIWACGAIYLGIRKLARTAWLRAELRRATAVAPTPELVEHLSNVFGTIEPPRIALSSTIPTPLVGGILRPKIIVPAALWMPGKELNDIITHETAHLHRQDHRLHCAQQITAALYWWHPLIHLVNRRVSLAREELCDNYVLRKSDRIAYAQTLFDVAGQLQRQVSPQCVGFFSHRPSLEERIAGLLDDSRDLAVRTRPAWKLATLVSAILLVIAMGGPRQDAGAANAQEPAGGAVEVTKRGDEGRETAAAAVDSEGDAVDAVADDAAAYVASGRILDADGKPVPDCLLVGKMGRAWSYSRETKSVRSDAGGNYRISFPGDLPTPLSIIGWAYAEGHGLRPVNFGYAFRDDRVVAGLDITLSEPQPITVRVGESTNDPTSGNKPAVGAVVGPHWLQVPNGSFTADQGQGLMGEPPLEILALLKVQTDQSGTAVLRGYPLWMLVRVAVESEAFGYQHFDFGSAENIQLELSPVGSIRGKLLTTESGRYQGQLLRIHTNESNFAGGNRNVQGYAEVRLDQQGSFAVPAIAIGNVRLEMDWGPDEAVVPLALPSLAVEPSIELEVNVELVQAVELRGQILTSDTREPAVEAVIVESDVRTLARPQATTDGDGRFSVRVPPGQVRLQVVYLGNSNATKGYEFPEQPIEVIAEAGAEAVDLAPNLLPKIPKVSFHVVDRSNAPLRNRTVQICWERGQYRKVVQEAVTDDAGDFQLQLSGLKVDGKLPLAYEFFLADTPQPDRTDEFGTALQVSLMGAGQIWLRASE